ncbi:MAG: flagellar type III secretion system protein FlhB [Zoogloea sp.]|nr:flagellar type III secretion system protein FlhB [Zoogloea sp.]
MAEDSDLEKTEAPSSRRLSQAREDGNVPHSRELSAFLVMMVGVAALYVTGRWGGHRMMGLMREGMHFDRHAAFDAGAMAHVMYTLSLDALLTATPLFAAVTLAALAAPFLMGGWVFSSKVFSPDFTRLNPLQGLTRIFSLNGVSELIKAVLKSALIGSVGGWVLWRERERMLGLMTQPLEASMDDFSQLVLFAALMTVASLLLVVAVDVPYQLWHYYSKLKMTKEEVRQEMKETDGDPQIKGRIRAMQREMARRRMMAEVPKASVVVTNPTHYAVALRYDPARAGAPVVVAKGVDSVALKIREIAGENKVPLLEAPPLARALFRHCELEEQIPATLYTAVAEVMAYVFQLNQFLASGGLPPQTPAEIVVPDGMDPEATLQ